MPGAKWLIAGGVLSSGAALLHLAAILGGAGWYRYLGAGERMARSVERGLWHPHLITIGIASVLAIWAAYAFSGAGLLPRMPLLKVGLVVITAIYLLRGSVLFLALAVNWGGVSAFTVWSSLIVLLYGVVYAIGTWLAWPRL